MHRLISVSILTLSFSVSLLTLSLGVGVASAQTTTATAIAPANLVTDSSGNLLVVERRAANSIPGAASTATGLVTRIIIIPPQAGASPSSAVYNGTMGNFYLGKRAVYSIFTTTTGGKTTRSLVAVDAGAGGALQPTLPIAPITNVGTSEIRVTPTNGNRDAIYVIQQPTLVRRPSSTTTTAPPTPSPRTIIYFEFDGTSFTKPRSVTVQ
jgi:hypothetical protein